MEPQGAKAGRGALPYPLFSVPYPTPPHPAEAAFRPRMSHNFNGFNVLHSCPVNQTVTKNP